MLWKGVRVETEDSRDRGWRSGILAGVGYRWDWVSKGGFKGGGRAFLGEVSHMGEPRGEQCGLAGKAG